MKQSALLTAPTYAEKLSLEKLWPENSWPENLWPENSWPESSWPEHPWPESSWPESSWPESSWPEHPWPEHSLSATFQPQKPRLEKLGLEKMGVVSEPSLVAAPSFSARSGRARATLAAPRMMPPSPPPMAGIAIASPSASIVPAPPTTLREASSVTVSACITADVADVTGDHMIQPNTLPTPWWKKSGKALIGAGVFTVLSGGILVGAHMFGGMAGHDMGGHGGGHDMGGHDMSGHDGHDMGGHDMGGMSHDDMMRVDGALNATPVTIEVAKPAPLEASVNYTGSIHPYSEVTVYPRVAGQLSNYEIYPGDRVTAGQTLASLEALERTSQTNEAQSTAAALLATVEGSQLELEEQQQAIALIQADLDYLKLQRDRFASLTQSGAIAQDQYDLVVSQVSAKEALLQGANAKRDRLQAKITSDQAQANRAQAQVNTAATLESYTTITSPISGVVQARMADPGVVVQPGMGILKIGDYQQVRLRANVAQQDANRIQIGTPITATVPGAETGVIRGTITTIFPQTDMTTRTMTVEAVVDNPDGQLLSGQFVDMQILTEQKAGAIALPQTALVDFKGEPSVWVVRQGKDGGNDEEMAQRRRVSVGLMSGDRIEITSGLESGDRVITSGHSRLMAGSTVTVVDDLASPSGSFAEVD